MVMAGEPKDWDAAYSNMAHIAGSEHLPAHWAAEAEAYRTSGVAIETDIAYGEAPRQKLDIVWPDGSPKGLAVFVHGGYWMRMYKSDWTQFAEGARANGWAVALPGYTLAPNARIAAIRQEIMAAVACAAERVSGPIRLAGHSAGGHLVSRLACADLNLAYADRIEHVLSISGLHDLRPLMNTQMNRVLQLDAAEAYAESVALLEPRPGVSLTAWVGGGELAEFIRQSQLLHTAWQSFAVATAIQVDSVHHHFSVLEGLKEPTSPITTAFIG